MRKIVQIISATVVGDDICFGNNVAVHALCDDGTVWEYTWPCNNGSGYWGKLPNIPQDEEFE